MRKKKFVAFIMLLLLFITIIVIGIYYKNAQIQKHTIEEYKSYSISEPKEFELSKISNEISYDVLDYEAYLKFCEACDISDTYSDESGYYMIVCIKPFSMGIEHHDYRIIEKGNVIDLHDHYTWGATGDKYGVFLCIPVESGTSLNYINEFEYEDYN